MNFIKSYEFYVKVADAVKKASDLWHVRDNDGWHAAHPLEKKAGCGTCAMSATVLEVS